MSDIEDEDNLPIAKEIVHKNDIIEIVIYNPNGQLNVGIPLSNQEGSVEILAATLNRSNNCNYCCIIILSITIAGILLLYYL
jgi:hypothetical protein